MILSWCITNILRMNFVTSSICSGYTLGRAQSKYYKVIWCTLLYIASMSYCTSIHLGCTPLKHVSLYTLLLSMFYNVLELIFFYFSCTYFVFSFRCNCAGYRQASDLIKMWILETISLIIKRRALKLLICKIGPTSK